MQNGPPLILTLKIDPESFTFFNELRQKNFPAAINYLDAHLTLFHHLPDVPLVPELPQTIATQQSILNMTVSKVFKLGRGVAYRIECQALIKLHYHLKENWNEWLTPQDRQGFRPHITVQNKVDPATANSLFEELTANFHPFTAQGFGLSLWEYQGGPWQKRMDFLFNPS